MLASSVVGQGEHGEDAAPELVAPYQSFARELLGLHGVLGLRGCCPAFAAALGVPLLPGPPQYQAALRLRVREWP